MSPDASTECRLCLRQSSEMYPLFSDNLLKMVEFITNIKLEEHVELSSCCCITCLMDLKSACDLKERILWSCEILQERLQKPALQDRCELKIENCETEIESKQCEINLEHEKFEIIKVVKQNPRRSKKRLPKRLECDQCELKFENVKAWRNHLHKHKLTKCPKCNRLIRVDNFKRHFEMHSASAEICEICGKTAKNKESLRGHMYYQHRTNPEAFKCEHCGRVFSYKSKYSLHIKQMHTGERNHQCEVCGKKFLTVTYLNRHKNMTHLKQRPYVCSYCSKAYSSHYALKTHVRQHTLETPYRCDICTAGFRQKVSLRTHMKSKHNTTLSDVVKSEPAEDVKKTDLIST